MINHTDKPIWLAHLGKIDSEIRHCLKEASEFIKKSMGWAQAGRTKVLPAGQRLCS